LNPSEYVADLHHFLQAHPAIASFHLATDYRGERFLYLSGKVEFAHGGTLDLKEFLEFHANRVERYHYAYNYRMSETLRFRYDNAPDPRAKHLSTYPSHKHEGETLVAASVPDLASVIAEILRHASQEP